MHLRLASHADVEAIVQLIQPYVQDFALDEQGRAKFSPAMIEKLLGAQDIEYWLAEKDAVLGVLSYRYPAHIVHFFVRQNHQNTGVGRQLWQHIEQQIMAQGHPKITVNSSCQAEPIYAHLGFVATDQVIEAQGLRFIPMQKTLPVRQDAPEEST